MPATSTTPAPLEGQRLCRRDCEMPAQSLRRRRRIQCVSGLIGQIKLTRIHVASLFLPRGAGSNETKSHLFTMSKDPDRGHRSVQQIQTCSLDQHTLYRWDVSVVGSLPRAAEQRQQVNPEGDIIFVQRRKVVEPDGIEPTTSCLQSRRSPS